MRVRFRTLAVLPSPRGSRWFRLVALMAIGPSYLPTTALMQGRKG